MYYSKHLIIIGCFLHFCIHVAAGNLPAISKDGFSVLDAVRLTIINQPDIRIQEKELELKKGALQYATGEFDTTFDAFINHEREASTYSMIDRISGVLEELETDTTIYGIKLNKKFRSGINVEQSLSVTYTDASTYPVDQMADYEPTSVGQIDFVITVPLLKGNGEKAAAADEMAARKEYQAATFELHHSISENILNTVLAYWDYLASYRILEKKKEAETNARDLVGDTEKLINTGKSPASEIEQVKANLADIIAARIVAEQTFFEAKQNLGLAMGISFDDIVSLPLPSDSFPVGKKQDISGLYESFERIVDKSLKQRSDLLAAMDKQDAGKILLEAAIRNLRPQLDLQFDLGYYGLSENGKYEDIVSPFSKNVAGLNFFVSLNYQWPFANNSSKGLLLQKNAIYDQTILSTNELKRNIRSNVLTALSDLKNSILELDQSRDAVSFYNNSVQNEKKMVLLGKSTLFDLVSIEDKQVNAMLAVISSEAKFSRALAKLRFETGSLMLADQDHAVIGIEELTTIPFAR